MTEIHAGIIKNQEKEKYKVMRHYEYRAEVGNEGLLKRGAGSGGQAMLVKWVRVRHKTAITPHLTQTQAPIGQPINI